MSRLARCVLLAAALALPALAAAQLYDPGFRWRTLETAHFRVHFHQGEEALAQDVAHAAERAHAALAPVIGHAPRGRTEVVLSDDVDDANGSATPLPYNVVRLYAAPPAGLSELSDYRDWLDVLVFHEYVHILHLDQVGGLPALANAVFGRLFFPNGLTPGWLVEGLAVTHEADAEPGTGTGRNESALFDMYTRALATEPPGFPRLDEVSNPFLDWPLGNVPYLLGGRFVAWLQARHGAEAVRGFLRDQGSQVWPYAPSWAGKRWFGGEDFPSLWRAYAADEEARFERQLEAVRARPVTRPTRLTTEGGRVTTPRWSPDGGFVAFTRRSLDRRPAVVTVTPDGRARTRVEALETNGALALRSPREAVVAAGEVWRLHRIYDDLWLVDLEDGTRRRLTDGARATDPALVPGGGAVVFVRRGDGGTMALVRRPLVASDAPAGGGSPRLRAPAGAEEVLFARRDAQVFAPAVSPDGGAVAFELHADGRRDLALWAGGAVTRLTDDAALDTAPAWTPDGRFVLFSSDRGGVFNLHAWERATGAVSQVTNVESGAFQPAVSPDGATIAFVWYGREGYDLATLPFDPAAWLAPAEPPAAAPPPARAEPAPLASRPYSPWRTLPPRWWLPLWGGDGAGTFLGAMTGGGDVLARHLWSLQAWWSLEGREPGYLAAYQGGWSWPLLDLSSLRYLDTSPGGDGLETVWTPLAAGLSFPVERLGGALSLRLGWSGTSYDTHGVGGTATEPEALGFQDGFLSDLSFTAVYTDARRFVRSISPEEGRTVTLTLQAAGPELGSDFAVARVRASVAQYLRLPGTDHAVLAVRLSGGLADGAIGLRAPFRLGGVAQADAVGLVLGTSAAPSDQLRGYPSGWLRGTGYALANTELRFPLARIGRGYSTWPLFLRRLHGAVFADLGDTFDLPGEARFAGHGFDVERLRLGAGAELRAELVLGYWLVTDVRLGAAHAFGRVFLGEARGRNVDPVALYLTLGSSF